MEIATVSYPASDAPQRFVESLRDTGFAVVVDHPLSLPVVEQVHADWAAFFASPTKREWLAGERQDGYYPPDRSETAVGAAVPDLKEFFHWYPWGQRPFDGATAELHSAGSRLAAELLGWIDAALPDDLAARLSMPLSRMLEGTQRTMLRVLHYPPLSGDEAEGAVRAAAHEDVNFITILPAATAAGLEVLARDGGWIAVTPDPGALIVNVGDGLQLASDGWLRSTTHRVVNPTGAAAWQSRYSTPLFLHPADDVRLSEEWTAFEFLQERIRQIRGDEIR